MSVVDILSYLAGFIAVIFVLVPHELGHAFAAYKCGDGTAKAMGRLTFNPLKHLDPVGFICCALVGFGWARPVPVNPANFKNYRKGMLITSAAGVVVNYIIAFFAFMLFALLSHFAFDDAVTITDGVIYYRAYDSLGYAGFFICLVFYLIYSYSLCVFVFNLLPLYPLDGFKVLESCTRSVNPVTRFLRDYGQMILIVLIAESFICGILDNYVGWAQYCDILGYIMRFATEIVGYPVQAAWRWIFTL